MTKDKSKLRRRAKELMTQNAEAIKELSLEEIQSLVVELQIHQIELEMQNQELRRTQLDLEDSRDKYSDLYDFAPVGYVAVSKEGIILQANLTFASMLDVERGSLIGIPLSRFVSKDDMEIFYLHVNTLLRTREKEICELKLIKKDGVLFYSHLESGIVVDSEGNVTQIRSAIADISNRKQMEEALQDSKGELEIRNKIVEAFLTFTDDQVFHNVLDIVLKAVKSQKGSLGYIEESGALVCPTMTKDVWDQCIIPDKTIVFERDTWAGLWGKSLVEKKPLYSNKPLSVPQGHIPIYRALSIPILFQNELIGQITVANKRTDYTKEDIKLMESITNYIAPVLKARLKGEFQERRRKLAEKELKIAYSALEQKVEDRTLELITTNEQLKRKIEEHKHAEKLLRESEEKYRVLIRTLPGVVYKGYQDWTVEFIDKKVELLTGHEPDKFNSGRLKWSDIIVEEDLETVKKSFILALKTGQAYVREYRIKGSSGELIWIQDRGHIDRNSRGDIEYISGVFFDITDRKKQEEEFRKTERLLQTVFDGIPNPLIMLDEKFHVKILNKAALAFYQKEKPEEIKQECCYQALMGKSEPCNGCRIPQLIAAKKSGSFERINIMDPTKLEEVTVYTFAPKNHRFGGALIRIQDITEAKIMERKMLHNEKLASLGLMVSSITHEITNPISAITFNSPILKDYMKALIDITDSYADNLQDLELFKMPYPKFKEDSVKIIENILHASQRIGKTVSNLRRLSSKKDRPKKRWVNVKQVIERIAALMLFEINQYVKFFEINCSENLPEIYSDPDTLEQILMNIIMNAAHAADKKDSRIILDAAPGDSWQDHLVIKISDNGCGMYKHTLSKIFAPFFSTKEPDQGTGLGLYVCQDLIKELGGRIEVESEVGKGSVFRVVLPDIERRSVTRL